MTFPVYQAKEWQCRYVFPNGRCCGLSLEHGGDHVMALAGGSEASFPMAELKGALPAGESDAEFEAAIDTLREGASSSHLQLLHDVCKVIVAVYSAGPMLTKHEEAEMHAVLQRIQDAVGASSPNEYCPTCGEYHELSTAGCPSVQEQASLPGEIAKESAPADAGLRALEKAAMQFGMLRGSWTFEQAWADWEQQRPERDAALSSSLPAADAGLRALVEKVRATIRRRMETARAEAQRHAERQDYPQMHLEQGRVSMGGLLLEDFEDLGADSDAALAALPVRHE